MKTASEQPSIPVSAEPPSPKFIIDQNAGKLVKWLRLMGYDTIFFDGSEDSQMVKVALEENRVIITRDTHIVERRVASKGRLRIVLLKTDEPEAQIKQVISSLKLGSRHPFSRCLECNHLLVEKTKDEIKELVPPYVYQTQNQYMQCPNCHRVYWRGTHWQAMVKRLEALSKR